MSLKMSTSKRTLQKSKERHMRRQSGSLRSVSSYSQGSTKGTRQKSRSKVTFKESPYASTVGTMNTKGQGTAINNFVHGSISLNNQRDSASRGRTGGNSTNYTSIRGSKIDYKKILQGTYVGQRSPASSNRPNQYQSYMQ